MGLKEKKKAAKKRTQRQKRREKYMRLFNEHRRQSPDMFAEFEILIAKLIALNPKYLQVMLEDLQLRGAIHPWTGEYHWTIINRAEMAILERTVLK